MRQPGTFCFFALPQCLELLFGLKKKKKTTRIKLNAMKPVPLALAIAKAISVKYHHSLHLVHLVRLLCTRLRALQWSWVKKTLKTRHIADNNSLGYQYRPPKAFLDKPGQGLSHHPPIPDRVTPVNTISLSTCSALSSFFCLDRLQKWTESSFKPGTTNSFQK